VCVTRSALYLSIKVRRAEMITNIFRRLAHPRASKTSSRCRPRLINPSLCFLFLHRRLILLIASTCNSHGENHFGTTAVKRIASHREPCGPGAHDLYHLLTFAPRTTATRCRRPLFATARRCTVFVVDIYRREKSPPITEPPRVLSH